MAELRVESEDNEISTLHFSIFILDITEET